MSTWEATAGPAPHYVMQTLLLGFVTQHFSIFIQNNLFFIRYCINDLIFFSMIRDPIRHPIRDPGFVLWSVLRSVILLLSTLDSEPCSDWWMLWFKIGDT